MQSQDTQKQSDITRQDGLLYGQNKIRTFPNVPIRKKFFNIKLIKTALA